MATGDQTFPEDYLELDVQKQIEILSFKIVYLLLFSLKSSSRYFWLFL